MLERESDGPNKHTMHGLNIVLGEIDHSIESISFCRPSCAFPSLGDFSDSSVYLSRKVGTSLSYKN